MTAEINDCMICLGCLRQADSAGQLQSSRECEREFPEQACEQCSGYLVDGEIFIADIEP